jgi:predicted MFS family arabinose efflux permease
MIYQGLIKCWKNTRQGTDPAQIGKQYQMVPGSYEYINQLGSEQGENLDFRVAVNIPTDVILHTILSSTKAFVVLFIACALIAFIFLNAGTSMIEMFNKRAKSSAKELSKLNFETGLHLVQPAYFMIVLVNALFVPFLPKLIGDIAIESGYNYATASLPFTLYYLVFALVLIPAGQYAERGNLKKMMVLGFIAEFFGMLLIFFSDDYILIVIARILSGIGQGLFLIGLQSYVMVITPKTQRSRGHAVKVVGRNAALIAGTAIGALLYAYIEYRFIFLVGSVISLISIAYLWNLVPHPESITGKIDLPLTENNQHPLQKLRRSIVTVMRDAEFLRTLTLVGIVGKMTIAGVVMFAIPLIMFGQGYKADDVGLMLMFYYMSSMVMTSYVSRIVDGAGMSRKALILSAMLGGWAIVVVGLVSHQDSSYETLMAGMEPLVWLSEQFIEAGMGGSTMVLYIAIILLGISNGLLAVPIMTHINNTDVSRKEGVKQVAATYVFLERFGHVAGPSIIAHLLFVNNNSPLSISLFGVIMLVLGGVYMVTSRGAEKTTSNPVLESKVAS